MRSFVVALAAAASACGGQEMRISPVNWGNTVELRANPSTQPQAKQYPLTEGAIAPVLSFPGLGQAQLYTVLLTRQPPPKSQTLTFNSEIACRVTVASGGLSRAFMLDWRSGSQFSVVANTVQIDAVGVAPGLDGTPYNFGNSQIEVLGATIAVGSHGQRTSTLTGKIYICPPTNGVVEFVPPEQATAVAFTINDASLSGGMAVEFAGYTSGQIVGISTFTVSSSLQAGVTVPAGSIVRVLNVGASPVQFRPIWFLDL